MPSTCVGSACRWPLRLTDIDVSKALRAGLRKSACAHFTTVLGPGSDGYHKEHIHLDFAQRHNGYRICQWDVRSVAAPAEVAAAQVPLPLPRPAKNLESKRGNRGRAHFQHRSCGIALP